MNISDLIESFTRHAARNLADNTRRQYASKLRAFGARFGAVELDQIETKPQRARFADDFEDWLHAMWHFPDGRKKAPDTCRMFFIVARTLFSWAVDRGYLDVSPIPKVELPASRRRERLPTDAETAAILQRAKPAFRLIFQALRQSGARPGELASATIGDISDGAIVLKQHKTARKSGTDRRIWIGDKLQALIDQAIGERTAGPIFLNDRGRPWKVPNLSRTFLRLKRAAKLAEELVLYLTRHEHATKLCGKHGIYVTAQALGHASIKTTQRYVHVDPEKQRNAQDDVAT